MISFCDLCAFLWLSYGDAVTQLFKVARGDEFISGDSGSDLDQVTICLTELHQTLFGMAVFDHVHTTDSRFIDNSARRNQHCRFNTLL